MKWRADDSFDRATAGFAALPLADRGVAGYFRRLAGYQSGLLAEWLASWLLRLKGYSILDRRYRTSVGEIDIVARRGRRLAFVEVKCRGDCGVATATVTLRQQQRIIRAAAVWQQRHPRYRTCEPAFDLVICGRRGGRRLWPTHRMDAFEMLLPGLRWRRLAVNAAG